MTKKKRDKKLRKCFGDTAFCYKFNFSEHSSSPQSFSSNVITSRASSNSQTHAWIPWISILRVAANNRDLGTENKAEQKCCCTGGWSEVVFVVLRFFTHGYCVVACVSLGSIAHSNCLNFNPTHLRAVLKPETMSSSAHAKQISVRFVYVYASLVRFFLSPFPMVSVAVRITDTVLTRFDRYLNLFESITKHCNTGVELFCILKLFKCCLFWHLWVALKCHLMYVQICSDMPQAFSLQEYGYVSNLMGLRGFVVRNRVRFSAWTYPITQSTWRVRNLWRDSSIS